METGTWCLLVGDAVSRASDLFAVTKSYEMLLRIPME